MSTDRRNNQSNNKFMNKLESNNLAKIKVILDKLVSNSNISIDLDDVIGIYQHNGYITILVKTGFEYKTWRNLRELVSNDYYQYDAKLKNTDYTLFAFDFSVSNEINTNLTANEMPPLNHDQHVVRT